MAKVLSINVAAKIHTEPWAGSVGKTGIDKRPVSGLVRFANNSVASDQVLDTKVHGGYDKAAYAYTREDADWWQEQIGTVINNGQFGENLTTSGIDLNTCLIGERWQIGEVILEVSEPRIPCKVFAGFWDRPTLIKEFTDARRSGTYLRIIEEGEFEAGAMINVISRPDHQITIKDIFSAKAGERDKVAQIQKVSQLSEKYRNWALALN